MSAEIHSPRALLEHPSARDRADGKASVISLGVLVGKSPNYRMCELSDSEALLLAADLIGFVRIRSHG